jgi:hypothetical protein
MMARGGLPHLHFFCRNALLGRGEVDLAPLGAPKLAQPDEYQRANLRAANMIG